MVKQDFILRVINKNDISQVIDMLQDISKFKPEESNYQKIWNNFCCQNNVHSIVAVLNDKIVGYGSMILETKITGGKRGHVEDIVSHKDFRKKGVGRLIVNSLFNIARENGCYKIVLQCKEHNLNFYKKLNYSINGIAMQRSL